VSAIFQKNSNAFWLFCCLQSALLAGLLIGAETGDFCFIIPLYILKDEKFLLYLDFF
jgi:hypothetical protein